MKSVKLAAVLVALLSTSITFADVGSIRTEVEQFSPKQGSKVDVLTVAPGLTFGQTYVDVKLSGARVDGSNTNLAEIRALRSFAVAPNADVFVRGGVGSVFQTGKRTNFVEGEVGAKYAVTPQISLNTSYKYVTATKSDEALKANIAYVGADYALTKVDAVGVKLYRAYGNDKGTGVQAAYTKAF